MNLKNDVRKVNEITTEMRINDLIYKIIDDELAGVNRPKDSSEFIRGNFGFAEELLETLKNTIINAS